MGISSTEASLRAIREDLDLPAAGSIDERAVLNKINKPYLPVSLSEYKGNILGTQLYIPGGDSPLEEIQWPKRRDEAFATYYGEKRGWVRVSGDRIQIEQADQIGNAYDYGTEFRICGKVLEDGKYRLTGTAYGDFAVAYDNQNHAQMHIQLLASTDDYLSGYQLLLVNKTYYARNTSDDTFYEDNLVDLSTKQPYVTFICRYIMSWQGRTTQTYTHEFTDFKLVKE